MPLLWDRLALPVLLRQIDPYLPEGVNVYVSTLLDSDEGVVSACEKGHVHVALGFMSSYSTIVVCLVQGVAAARAIAAAPVGTLCTADALHASLRELLAIAPEILGALPEELRAAVFEELRPIRSGLH